MNPLSRIEALIAEIVERPAWGLAPRRVHPLELTTALVKGMELRAIRLADRILAPDRYEIRLNPADFEPFADAQSVLERELAEYLLRTFEERDLSCNLPPTVQLLADARTRPGRLDVSAGFSPIPDPADRTVMSGTRPARDVVAAVPRRPATVADSQTTPGSAWLEIVGPDGAVVRAFHLERSATTIGRRSSTDVPLLDTGVSREHARIDREGSGYVLVDLNSTNGTVVNGRPVQGRRRLNDGDVLGIGRYRLRFVQR